MNLKFDCNNVTSVRIRDGARTGLKFVICFFLFFTILMGPVFFFSVAFGDMVEGASRIPGIATGIIFTVISAVLIVVLIRMNRSDRLVRTYISTVGNLKRVELKWLSETLKRPVEKILPELREVMRRGYFKDGYLDINNGVLLFPNVDLGAEISVTCPNCGAVVKARQGYSAFCPYCGTAVQ